ncbi:hypothetical protein ACFYNL_16205 [Streptomyces sp. NPDC007808]|uniref:hypothetical protein n=1 Tax=Streptomyces sp. NPDC007808 TaxID=3364779 RepID=UPI00367604BD
MSSIARSLPRGRAWLRVLVLLLALLVPGAHARTPAVPVVAGALGEAAEHDTLDTALRPPARADRRGTAGLSPTPAARPPCVPARRTPAAPPDPPYVPPHLRTVVLRC